MMNTGCPNFNMRCRQPRRREVILFSNVLLLYLIFIYAYFTVHSAPHMRKNVKKILVVYCIRYTDIFFFEIYK